jgi:hypothetical protein
MTPGTIALAVVLVALGCLSAGAALAVLVTRARAARRRKREKQREMETKQMKALMRALVSTKESSAAEVGLSFRLLCTTGKICDAG